MGAKILSHYYEKKVSVRKKGRTNLVTEVDEKVQKAIIKEIKKNFPDDAILAEEGDFSTTRSAKRRWIIDPLDGTTNFAHGYPCFCVSVAFEEDGIVRVGVIHDPNRKEVFHAVKGKGAFLNKKKIRVSEPKALEDCLLVTGFPYDLQNSSINNLPLFCHMLMYARAVRRDGSAALNLAYVAAGRFDGFWELGVKAWDVAAGLLLIREAGGAVQPLEASDAENPEKLVTAHPEILKLILDELPRA